MNSVIQGPKAVDAWYGITTSATPSRRILQRGDNKSWRNGAILQLPSRGLDRTPPFDEGLSEQAETNFNSSTDDYSFNTRCFGKPSEKQQYIAS
ncbi:hypothetical protein PGTUg99_033950 [Puccinia graminis f. sp. tritici]|uniref:Uncharacterized protein n=1 Tax=Puccinia graminis f. sp. tritici TaxID=56615 RepID=A0A5B0SJL0_PUCGR|nr:hypothetical protein PGTUg99_001640 [Puccinia graminis f. sp. tritici]KAA1138396.1 hypothetical protein PGTUg99_033950 [Puccinia graminis f. sp. tritici]